MNSYGDVVTDKLKQANSKVAVMAIRRQERANGFQMVSVPVKSFKSGGEGGI